MDNHNVQISLLELGHALMVLAVLYECICALKDSSVKNGRKSLFTKSISPCRFVHAQHLEESNINLMFHMGAGVRARPPACAPLQLSRHLEARVADLEGVANVRHWLRLIGMSYLLRAIRLNVICACPRSDWLCMYYNPGFVMCSLDVNGVCLANAHTLCPSPNIDCHCLHPMSPGFEHQLVTFRLTHITIGCHAGINAQTRRSVFALICQLVTRCMLRASYKYIGSCIAWSIPQPLLTCKIPHQGNST